MFFLFFFRVKHLNMMQQFSQLAKHVLLLLFTTKGPSPRWLRPIVQIFTWKGSTEVPRVHPFPQLFQWNVKRRLAQVASGIISSLRCQSDGQEHGTFVFCLTLIVRIL